VLTIPLHPSGLVYLPAGLGTDWSCLLTRGQTLDPTGTLDPEGMDVDYEWFAPHVLVAPSVFIVAAAPAASLIDDVREGRDVNTGDSGGCGGTGSGGVSDKETATRE